MDGEEREKRERKKRGNREERGEGRKRVMEEREERRVVYKPRELRSHRKVTHYSEEHVGMQPKLEENCSLSLGAQL